MARYATHLTNGTSGPEGLTRLLGKLLNGTGVLSSTDLVVSAQSTPDMTVKLAAGDIAMYAGAIVYHGWSTANENVTIAANGSGSAKTDSIVAYIDPAAASTTENNPDGLKFLSVRGSTSAPTGTEINAAIGSKPYAVLNDVAVGNGVSSINAGNLTDRRTLATINIDKLGGGSGWTAWSPNWNIIGGSATLAGGGLYGRYKKIGRTVTGWMLLVYANDTTTSGGGAWFFSLPVPPVANTLSQMIIGNMMFADASAAVRYNGQTLLTRTDDPNAAGKLIGRYPTTPSVPSQTADVTAGTLTWAGGDSLFMSFEYEAAA